MARAAGRFARGWRWLAVFSLLAFATLGAIAVSVTPSFADDGGGDGGGAGGGGDGGGDGGSGGGEVYSSSPFGKSTMRCRTVKLSTFLKTFKVRCYRVGARRSRKVRKPRVSTAQAERAPVVSPQQRREIVGARLSPGDILALEAAGFTVLTEAASSSLTGQVARLAIPAGRSLRSSLRLARATAPNGLFDNNDLYGLIYRPASATAASDPIEQGCGLNCRTRGLIQWPAQQPSCTAKVVIGIVDTGIDAAHPSLTGVSLSTRSFRRTDRSESDRDHGTAVASMLVGNGQDGIVGLVPGAQLLAADAFHATRNGSRSDTFDLITAMDWLADGGANVINLSLSGPRNQVLEEAVTKLSERNIAIVAAAGVAGSRSASGYPARYEPVVAVSAVDDRLRPLRSATRGGHLDLVAPGNRVNAARSNGQVAANTGTSFAAPFVAAALALARSSGEPADATAQRLAEAARDLGQQGRDPIYGWGLLQMSGVSLCR